MLNASPEELLAQCHGSENELPLMICLKVLLPKGMPPLPSLMLSATADGLGYGSRELAHSVAQCRECGVTAQDIDDVNRTMARYQASAVPIGKVEVRYDNGTDMTYLVCESSYNGFEGTAVRTGVVLESVRSVYPEILLSALSYKAYKIMRDGTPMGTALKVCAVKSNRQDLAHPPVLMRENAPFLSKNRFVQLSTFLECCLRCIGVRSVGIPASVRLNTELRNKTARTKELERQSRFLERFAEVELCNETTPERLDEMYACFDDLLSAGLLPVQRAPITIRVRKSISRSMAAVYYRSTFTMVVAADNPGTFVHEYMHAYDHTSGDVSRKKGFREVLQLYRSIIRADDAITSRRKTYFCRAEEAYARCFEMHVWRLTGMSILLSFKPGSMGYPLDEGLATLVDEYFTKVRLTWDNPLTVIPEEIPEDE